MRRAQKTALCLVALQIKWEMTPKSHERGEEAILMNKVVIAVKVVVTGVGTEVVRGLLFTEEETAQQNDLTFQIVLTAEWNQTKKASVQIVEQQLFPWSAELPFVVNSFFRSSIRKIIHSLVEIIERLKELKEIRLTWRLYLLAEWEGRTRGYLARSHAWWTEPSAAYSLKTAPFLFFLILLARILRSRTAFYNLACCVKRDLKFMQCFSSKARGGPQGSSYEWRFTSRYNMVRCGCLYRFRNLLPCQPWIKCKGHESKGCDRQFKKLLIFKQTLLATHSKFKENSMKRYDNQCECVKGQLDKMKSWVTGLNTSRIFIAPRKCK